MAITAITLAGCKDEESAEDPGTNPPAPVALRPSEVLGRGYDATQEYAREEYVASAVLDVDKLLNANLIEDIVEPRTSSKNVIYGNSLEDYHKKLSIKLGMEGKAYGFTASCNSNFTLTSTDKYTYSYLTGRYCYKKYIFKIKPSPIQDLIPCLTDAFIEDVYRMSAEDLVKRYGTHVINGLSTGGVIEYHSSAKRSTNETEEDMGIHMKAGFEGKFSASRSGDVTLFLQFKQHHSECEEKMVCRGGDSHIIMAAYDSTSIESSKLSRWCESIADDSKSVMVDFEGPENVENGCLIPLYEFILDPDKQEEVRAYIIPRMTNPWMSKDSEVLTVYLR